MDLQANTFFRGYRGPATGIEPGGLRLMTALPRTWLARSEWNGGGHRPARHARETEDGSLVQG